MSGGSSANNSWTILTPEETVTETLRPLAEGTEDHEESLASAAEKSKHTKKRHFKPCKNVLSAYWPGSGADQPAERCPVEGQVVSEERAAQQMGDASTEQHISVPATITDASVPTSLEVSRSFAPGNDALSQAEGLPEHLTQSNPDPDSFSDSYTHISTSPDETPVALLSTETLEGGEFRQEEERLTEEGTLHLQSGEELQQDKAGKRADSPVDAEVGEEKTGEEEEPEVRRRSLLAALEQIRRTEEEEDGEEEFQLPRREEDSGFSVNKCILGAVILLGLGTIFFSESDYGTRELKDSEVPGKQDWLNPDVPPAPVDADNIEILNKLAEGNQQISVLQAQLQAQTEELKVARGHAAEGAKERRWEEVEKENSRLKTEMASFSVLQKENKRMKRELESVSALQKELETLRSTVTELKLSSAAGEATVASVEQTTSPPSGQPEDTRQGIAGTTEKHARKPWVEQKEKNKDRNRDKYDTGEKKWKEKVKSEWKEGEKTDRKDVGKTEWKTGKHEQRKSDKEKDKEGKQKKHSETKQWKDKDWKKEKAGRGDEGKPWKAREGKKEWIEKSERRELKEEKDWKKAKHDKVNEKQWRDKEEKRDSKGGNGYGERHRGKEEWKEWKKVKDAFKKSGKEKLEKKDWKEKGEKKEWKTKNFKDQDKEGKVKGERKQWEESGNYGKERNKKNERKHWSENEWKSKNAKDDKEWKRKGERKQWEKKEYEEEWNRGRQKEKRHGEWKEDRSSSQQHIDEHKFTGNKHHDQNEEYMWGDRNPPHTHRRPSLEQPEYWVQQRDRLQHNRKPPQHCSSLETCAQAEGLLPVPLPEFEAILQNYLAKAEETGVEASVTEELKKLTTEFFKDGVFVHDQTSFQDFVEDIGDILEHMVEGDEEEEDSAIEEEMEEFEREVLKKFSVSEAGEKEERIKGEWRKESRQGRG